MRLAEPVAAREVAPPEAAPRDASPALEAALGGDLLAALARLGLEPLAATPIAGLRGGGAPTLRVDLRGGGVVKARRLRSGKARRFARLVAALASPAFAPPLACDGRLVIEPWIDGAPLDALPPTEARLLAAADLLAGLHATTALGGRPIPARAPTARLARRTRRRIAGLLAARAIDAPLAGSLIRGLAGAPPEAALALAHGDLCAENLVEDRAGRVVSIDHEGLEVGFVELDLARVWYRWPMPAADFARFVARCRERRPGPAGVAPFWRIAAAARGAQVRLLRGPERLGEAVARLREVAREVGARDVPAAGTPESGAPASAGEARA